MNALENMARRNSTPLTISNRMSSLIAKPINFEEPLATTNINVFLSMYSVMKLIFFSGYSHIYESYLCQLKKGAENWTDTRPNKVILEVLKVGQNPKSSK